jgi:hypothetical protein
VRQASWDVPETLPPLTTESRPGSGKSGSSKATTSALTTQKPARVSFLTEQTSHHPPVSAFYIDCPEKGIYANGYDQVRIMLPKLIVKLYLTGFIDQRKVHGHLNKSHTGRSQFGHLYYAAQSRR